LLLHAIAGRARLDLGQRRVGFDGQHFACDWPVRDRARRPAVRCPCLTDNVSLYSAWANDAAREDVFANQMRAAPERDALILISVSRGQGLFRRSVNGLRYAREVGAATISLVGFDGGTLHRESTCFDLVRSIRRRRPRGMHLVVEAPADGSVAPGLAERGKSLMDVFRGDFKISLSLAERSRGGGRRFFQSFFGLGQAAACLGPSPRVSRSFGPC